jgi:hypothetical protein
MKKIVLCISLLTSFISVCPAQLGDSGPTPPKGLTTEEYNILAGAMLCGEKQPRALFRITFPPFRGMVPYNDKSTMSPKSETVTGIHDFYARAQFTDLTDKLIEDFERKNDKSYLVESKLPDCPTTTVITDSKTYFATHPLGSISMVSRAGISPDGKQALVYEAYSGNDFGSRSGCYSLLAKLNGEWQSVRVFDCWEE